MDALTHELDRTRSKRAARQAAGPKRARHDRWGLFQAYPPHATRLPGPPLLQTYCISSL